MKIERLEIKSRNIKKQGEFYGKILGLEIRNKTADSFEVIIGSSVLKLTESKPATPYHIAFHIPPDKIRNALDWTKVRVEVQKNDDEEIVDFSAWNAMSLYFYDADNNILEFISRRDLYPPADEAFSHKSILGIAEAGLATNSIPEKFSNLEQSIGLQKYDGNFENFCAIGDEEGLLITINKNKKDWFPTNDKAFASEFIMIIDHQQKKFKLEFEKDELMVFYEPI